LDDAFLGNFLPKKGSFSTVQVVQTGSKISEKSKLQSRGYLFVDISIFIFIILLSIYFSNTYFGLSFGKNSPIEVQIQFTKENWKNFVSWIVPKTVFLGFVNFILFIFPTTLHISKNCILQNIKNIRFLLKCPETIIDNSAIIVLWISFEEVRYRVRYVIANHIVEVCRCNRKYWPYI